MMRVLIALAIATSACLEARLVPCGDLLCPVGATCTETGCMCAGGPCPTRCGNSIVEQGEACDDGNQLGADGCNGTCTSDESCGNGIVELAEQCDCGDVDRPGPATCGDTINGGAICSDTCGLRRCGDGSMDPGEACDDGNNVAGDGCNFDCTSSETCGNGVLDYFAGELCDDGNTRNRDGCGGTCRPETIAWESFVGTLPAPIENVAIAYDAGRERIVAFGGTVNGERVGGSLTYELEGSTWREVAIPVSPPGRFDAVMTYDASRARIVMYGGEGDAGCLNDTWEFDGTTWIEVVTPTKPPANCGQSLAYDSVRDRLVLRVRDDLWELDGTWSEVAPPPAPNGELVFDAARGVMVMVSGRQLYERTSTGSWVLHGAQVPDVQGTFVYDATRRRIVVFGRNTSNATVVWDFDGTTWTPRLTGPPPPERYGEGVVYDIARQRLVVFAGNRNSFSVNDTWQLVDATWSLLTSPNLGSMSGHFIAFDARRGCTVLVDAAVTTWELCGDTWTARSMPTPVGPMVYDSARRLIVLYRGATGETWEYDGGTWVSRTLPNSPPPRTGAKLAYDSARSRTVLFGGSIDTDFVRETWTYNGTTWTLESPVDRPNGSYWDLAYDARRDRVVAFGGLEFGGDRTWEYDGTNWARVFPAVSPPRRLAPGMTYDPIRERIVLFGGQADSGAYDDTWAYDGATWSRIYSPVGPTRRIGPAMTFDSARGYVVMYGGGALAGQDVTTWRLATQPSAPIESCTTNIDHDRDGARGCADNDCSGRCTACGNGACDPTENCHTCPADCDLESKGCVVACGDATCDTSESLATCPGDCTP
jgi:cysteine-rich repeat protein